MLANVPAGFSEHSLSIRQCVKNIFAELHDNLATGDVLVLQLQNVREKWEHVIQILQSLSLDQLSFAKVLENMESRVNIFTFYSYLLRHFADMFPQKLQGGFY